MTTEKIMFRPLHPPGTDPRLTRVRFATGPEPTLSKPKTSQPDSGPGSTYDRLDSAAPRADQAGSPDQKLALMPTVNRAPGSGNQASL